MQNKYQLHKDEVIKDLSKKVILYATSQSVQGEKLQLLYNVESERKVMFHVMLGDKSKYSGISLQRALDVFNAISA